MSDDLVKRLRNPCVCSLGLNPCRNAMVCDQAADRIKELEAENKRLRLEVTHANDTADAAIGRINGLEAKQKKAAQYFTKIILHCANFGRGVPSIDERIIERCEDTAANAIEELAGGKDE